MEISLKKNNKLFPLSVLPTCPTPAPSFLTTPGLGADNPVLGHSPLLKKKNRNKDVSRRRKCYKLDLAMSET